MTPTEPVSEGAALPSVPAPRVLGRVGLALTVASWVGAVALVALSVVGKTDRAPPNWLILFVTFLPYLYGLFVAWLFALWTAAPDRRSVPAALSLVCVAALVQWGGAWVSLRRDLEGDELRVMSWNLRRLWGGPDDGGDPTTCAIDAIRAADPDVLALLEVSKIDVGAIGSALGLDCAHATYRSGGGKTKGGLAVCVRGGDWVLRSGEGQRFVDPKDWHYVFAEVERAGRVVNVLAVHLRPYELAMNDWLEVGREGSEVVAAQSDQAAALIDRMGKLRDPTVVAGDFNSTRDAALHVDLRRHLADAWERGGNGFGGTVALGGWAPLRVDYVYASEELGVGRARVLDAGCSDHKPILTELVLRD